VRSLPKSCPLRFMGGPKPVGLGPGLRVGSDRASFAHVYYVESIVGFLVWTMGDIISD
jgi:hypothetical protein